MKLFVRAVGLKGKAGDQDRLVELGRASYDLATRLNQGRKPQAETRCHP